MRKDFNSDAIKIDTGHNNAGNGGDGYNFGNVSTTQSLNINPYNKADADIGAQTHQKLAWDAPALPHDSGSGNASATQLNFVWADQTQTVLAGVGGNGGDHNHAVGGIELSDFPHALSY
jgi:hypothetical protein